MKQVTGSKVSAETKKVSIQLMLDGHSFSTEGLDADAACIDIELLTPRSMLVPQELFDPANAQSLLGANGMACAENECAVWSDPQQPVVALMAFSCVEIDAVRDRLGQAAMFTTPLLREPKLNTPAVWLYAATGLLYIKVYTPVLRFAEVVTVTGDDDLLYYAELLNRRFTLETFRVYTEGDNTIRLRAVFSKYTRQIQ